MDEAGDASAVLLRDVHCALLLALGSGKGLGASDARQPGSATISSPEEHSPSPWTLRVSQAVLAAPLDVAPDDAKVLSPGCLGPSCCGLQMHAFIVLAKLHDDQHG